MWRSRRLKLQGNVEGQGSRLQQHCSLLACQRKHCPPTSPLQLCTCCQTRGIACLASRHPQLQVSHTHLRPQTFSLALACPGQVVRLAQEVAALQQQLAELAGVKRRQLDAELAELTAREQALAARRDAAELGELKQQLHALRLSGGAGGACGSGANTGGPAGGHMGRMVGSNGSVEPGGSSTVLAAAGNSAAGAAESQNKENGGGRVLHGQLGQAVQRLLRERELLLDTGAYSPDDPLIAQVDARIRECAALAHRDGGGG